MDETLIQKLQRFAEHTRRTSKGGMEAEAALFEEAAAALAQQAGAVRKLSDVELRAVNGIIDAQEYEAGDVDDEPPSIDTDEDAYWAYHSYHGLMKLIASSGPGGGGEVS